MEWPYAELSKAAKECGGPEKLVEQLIASGRKEMLPWIGVAAAGGAVAMVGSQKAFQYFSRKYMVSQEEAAAAKEELIAGIKNYDSDQVAKNNEATQKD